MKANFSKLSIATFYWLPIFALKFYWLGQYIFISWFINPPTVIFRKVEKNKI